MPRIIECLSIIKHLIMPDIGSIIKQYYIALNRTQYVFESIDNIESLLTNKILISQTIDTNTSILPTIVDMLVGREPVDILDSCVNYNAPIIQVHALIHVSYPQVIQQFCKEDYFIYVISRPHSDNCTYNQYIHFSISFDRNLYRLRILSCNCNAQTKINWQTSIVYFDELILRPTLIKFSAVGAKYFRADHTFGQRTWI